MKQYYDPINNRLVYIENKASALFWDMHWEKYDVTKTVQSAALNRRILLPTRRYLPTGSRILEGGCGLGQNVWSLYKHGYDVYGVDYADETVKKVNSCMPELNVSHGDLRDLKFESNFFDGYWSLGVIEHFYNGYDALAIEMKRVIKPNGYLFLTFPCMSGFRKYKAKRGKYKIWKENQALVDRFYQFALSFERVKANFVENGFELVQSKATSGLKGLKDEIENKSLKNMFQKFYDSTHLPARVMAWGFDQMLSPFFGHVRLLIFKKLN